MSKQESVIEPSPFLRNFRVYSPPRPKAPVDLFLDGNEGMEMSAGLLGEIVRAGAESVRRYPDASPLERQIAEIMDVPPGRVIVTAGGDDAIERVIRATLSPGREVILPAPTFEMFERYAKLTGCSIVKIPWSNGSFPIENVLENITEKTALIVVATPNSPTGLVATAADLKRLSSHAPNVLLLVDLAYTEFADIDLTATSIALQNAVAIRSFSKAWGLAGLRVGWAIGHQKVIEWMRAVGHPYAVAAPSLVVASAKLRTGSATVAQFAANVREERDMLTDLLTGMGAECVPSQANFLLARFENAEWVREALIGLGISVRIFPGKQYLKGCLRITLPGDIRKFERLTKGLKTIFAPQALLFDIDNTLVDVSNSYRRAILKTAEFFGVSVSNGEISATKAAGGANNDWELTLRLIKEKGLDVSLAEVAKKFEELYQGTAKKPGFRAAETLLVEREVLERLALKYKLGIVTGRPRKDANAVLKAQGLTDLFDVVVTMEDAMPKPDPAPVSKALEKLGVERAWMIGDTPDDIKSARAAGVLPIGVIGPSDEPAAAESVLTSAGAGRVISSIKKLEKLLP